MRRLFLTLFTVLFSVSFVSAQAQPQRDVEGEKQKAREAAFNNRVDVLRNNGKQRYIRDRYKRGRVFDNKIRPLYRDDLTDEEKSIVAPNDADLAKYSDFLKNKNTGITKLLIDNGCDGGTEILVAKPICEKYTMPGAGASYSFRAERYSIKRLADINFNGKHFDTDGLIKHGILVNIGNIPIEKVSLETAQLSPLVGFKPITKFEDAGIASASLKEGVNAGSYKFGSWIKVKENNTYALRSIAYKSSVYRRVEDVEYDELDFDERDDVIIVFRVIRHNPGQDVTILWKRLKKDGAPKMSRPTNQEVK